MKHQPIGRRRFLQGSAALIGGHSLAAGMPLAAQPQAANEQAPKPADRFAAMALQPATEIRGRLVENPPPIFPKVELEAERNSPSVDFPLRPLMHTREEFRAALAELRQQYEPFLADYTPPMPATRARVELDAFQFRLEEPDDLRDFSRVGRGDAP